MLRWDDTGSGRACQIAHSNARGVIWDSALYNPMVGFRGFLEGAEEDRRVSNLAGRVWDRIVKSFDGLGLVRMSLSLPLRGGGVVEAAGWGFDLGVLFPEFSGLRVFFCNLDSRASASYDPRSRVILIPLVRGDPDPSERQVRLRFRSWHGDYRARFMHEFVHYLDHSRGVRFRDAVPRDSEDGVASYFNSPEEFNAYYQDLVSLMSRRLKPGDFRVPFGEFVGRVRGLMGSYDLGRKFYGVFSPGPRKWMDHLDDGYRRRFLSRLYGYYSMRRA